MQQKPTISIIVPVYNTEKYLRKCIDSIISQSFTDWECLLIDDGSTDASGVICDEYAKKDSRIKVFHKENGGVSSARNYGLDRITTDWVTVIDADDTIHKDYLKILNESIENESIHVAVACSARYNDNGDFYQCTFYDDNLLEINQFIINKLIRHVSWGYFYDSRIIRKYNIKYDESLIMSEDAVFLLEFFQYVKSIKTISKILYYYRDNEDSVSNSKVEYRHMYCHYRAAIRIYELSSNGLLSFAAIVKSFGAQFGMFITDLRKIHLTKESSVDAREKCKHIMKVVDRKYLPKVFFVSRFSIGMFLLVHRCFLKYDYVKNKLSKKNEHER